MIYVLISCSVFLLLLKFLHLCFFISVFAWGLSCEYAVCSLVYFIRNKAAGMTLSHFPRNQTQNNNDIQLKGALCNNRKQFHVLMMFYDRPYACGLLRDVINETLSVTWTSLRMFCWSCLILLDCGFLCEDACNLESNSTLSKQNNIWKYKDAGNENTSLQGPQNILSYHWF